MKTKRVILIGLFSAICYVGTILGITFYIGGSPTMVHLGTTAIFLSAILIGKDAGFAGAIGCALFDLLDPKYVLFAIPTFIIKGLTGYVAGKVAFSMGKQGNSNILNIIGFILGGIVSLIGYFLVNWIVFFGFEVAVLKLGSSLITTALGIAITIPISLIIKPLLKKGSIKVYE